MTDSILEAMEWAIRQADIDSGDIITGGFASVQAIAAIQALCTHVGLTVEVLEMIRRGEAVVVPTKMLSGAPLIELIYEYPDGEQGEHFSPIERQKT